jgi:glutathione S-transferase
MGFHYVSTEEAIGRGGLRMVVVGGLPSPWGEAAKGIFHIKNIDWVAVRLAYDDEALKNWAGQRSGPIAFYENEKPRSGWHEILLLAERLAPGRPLLPADEAERVLVLGIAQELCGEGGLGWSRRLQMIDAGGFAEPVAKYLARKYGYRPEIGEDARKRVVAIVTMLVARLKAQRAAGSRYLVGDALTAADVYCATFAAMFRPLPPDVCAMDRHMRRAFETPDKAVESALDPVLFEHRDMMYGEHLELPLSL